MMQQLATAQAARQAAEWSAQVDAALPPEQGAQPSARLTALTDAVIASLAETHEQSALLATDVRLTAAWLQAELATGVAWRETRAAALLHGAAALGALWFVDERLLLPYRLLPLPEPDTGNPAAARNFPPLLASPQGERFAAAADQEKALRPGAQFALREALAGGFAGHLARGLVAAAFCADTDRERPDRQQAAERFIAREHALQAQAAITDADLRTLCMGGDLVLGLGRSVRLLSNPAAPRDRAALLTWLRSAINGLAGLSE